MGLKASICRDKVIQEIRYTCSKRKDIKATRVRSQQEAIEAQEYLDKQVIRIGRNILVRMEVEK